MNPGEPAYDHPHGDPYGMSPNARISVGGYIPALTGGLPTSQEGNLHMNDLYDRDLTGVAFTRLCGGNTGEEGEACVELAPIPGVKDAFALRDSKNRDAGTLRFSGAELRAAGMTIIG
jgi:Domain of unknown function (DUF397)